MTRRDFFATSALLGVPVHAAEAGQPDWRNVKNGWQIPREGYSDQPYVVVTRDGNWLCVLTTGRGVEGEPGQHIISTISTDQGRTWSTPIDIEPADAPEKLEIKNLDRRCARLDTGVGRRPFHAETGYPREGPRPESERSSSASGAAGCVTR